MDEFANLFLRGKYAEELKSYELWLRWISVVGTLLMLVAAILTWANVPLRACAVVTALGLLTETGATVLALQKPRRIFSLAFGQNEQNALLKQGEERKRHEAVYTAFQEAFRGFSGGKRLWIFGFLRIVAPLVLAVCCLLVSAGVAVNEYVLFSFVTFALLSGGAGVYDVLSESRARSMFYHLAQKEIDEIKREELHMSAAKTLREAETARAASSIPASVELLLKEDIEREDYRRTSRWGGAIGFALGAIYFVVLILGITLGNYADKVGNEVVWSIILSVFALILAVTVLSIYPIARRQKEIFSRNAGKLKDSEGDLLRAELQIMWIKSQRAGNIMFAVFTVGSIALGVTFGLLAYFTGEDPMPLAQSLSVGILPFLVFGAILALVVWIVMYAVARSKMRPVENRLREMLRTEIK